MYLKAFQILVSHMPDTALDASHKLTGLCFITAFAILSRKELRVEATFEANFAGHIVRNWQCWSYYPGLADSQVRALSSHTTWPFNGAF